MLVSNKHLGVFEHGKNYTAQKGYVYLAISAMSRKLYIVKQTGQRSWDAFNMDFESGIMHIHSNRGAIFNDIWEQTGTGTLIYPFSDKIALRKAIMEFQAYGTNGEQDFIIEKAD